MVKVSICALSATLTMRAVQDLFAVTLSVTERRVISSKPASLLLNLTDSALDGFKIRVTGYPTRTECPCHRQTWRDTYVEAGSWTCPK